MAMSVDPHKRVEESMKEVALIRKGKIRRKSARELLKNYKDVRRNYGEK